MNNGLQDIFMLNDWLQDAFTVKQTYTTSNKTTMYKIVNENFLYCYNCHGNVEYIWKYCPWCGVKL